METLDRTVATFQSTSFNTAEQREYFINPCCFGDDLARWLIDRLRSTGIDTDAEPGQEDFGWYFNFKLGENVYCVVLGFRPAKRMRRVSGLHGWREREGWWDQYSGSEKKI
jgi:hypothetical protein